MSRRPQVRRTLVDRVCADCGRTALDVRLDPDGALRCPHGVGCRGRAERARAILRGCA